jgi:hypothetical protein
MLTSRARFVGVEVLSFIFVFIFASNAMAFECFSPPPSVEEGRGVFEHVRPRDLVDHEYQELEGLMQRLDGKWAGEAEIVVCTGREDEIFRETDKYSIESTGKMSRSGDFTLNSTLSSREKKTKQHEIIRLCVNRERLATVCNLGESDIELISVSNDELIYLKKSFRKLGKNKLVNEMVTAIRYSAETSFTLEKLVYFQGKLKTIIIWQLEKE